MKIPFVAAALIAVTSTAALADPKPNPNSNQSPVAQATLAYKAAGYPAGSTWQVISDRNTNPMRGAGKAFISLYPLIGNVQGVSPLISVVQPT